MTKSAAFLSNLICASVLVGFVAFETQAAPAAQPLPKSGACPSGYTTSGKYCVPSRAARFAVIKNGACPSGYSTSGHYCVATSDRSKLAIPKLGACPSGYSTSGQYCLSNK